MAKIVYNFPERGLSTSAFNLWFVNPVAFELQYFHDLEPVEEWNKNTGYGSLVGNGIEGWLKTRTKESINEYITRYYMREFKKYSDYEEIVWWAKLAIFQTDIFIRKYYKDFNRYEINEAELSIKAPITLPSGRIIVLSGRLDGNNKDGSVIFEHKAKKDWNTERIASEVDLDLQVNWYLTLCLCKFGSLPKVLWYQHSRRPGGYGYRGPKRKKGETSDEFLKRSCDYIADNVDDHFYQFIARPKMERYQRFMNLCMYPLLERFMDWWEYKTGKITGVNKYHYLTPYGLYNPYLEGTDEKFRTFSLTGSTVGLRKVRNGNYTDKEKTSNDTPD